MIHLAGTLAAILSFMTHPAPSEAAGAAGSAADGPGLVTREWSWPGDEGTTVLTARGPAAQVSAFEPGDPPSRCPDCVLMSSVAFGKPEGAAPADADKPVKALAGPDR